MISILAWVIPMALFLAPLSSRLPQQVQPTGETPAVAVQSPAPGQALQGIVTVTGRMPADGFRSAELSFTYDQDPRQTWFLIEEFSETVAEGALAEWDTTLLTDGEYLLRLLVRMENGEQIEATVPGLRVRNYSPVETDTPAPTPSPPPGETPAPSPSPLPSETARPATPTPLPPNPAAITGQDIRGSLVKGVLIAMGSFALLGLYGRLRSAARRRRSRRGSR
jgi:hypothetical protein